MWYTETKPGCSSHVPRPANQIVPETQQAASMAAASTIRQAMSKTCQSLLAGLAVVQFWTLTRPAATCEGNIHSTQMLIFRLEL